MLENRLGRFFWADPRVIADDDARPEQFRAAMSALHVGDTIKITGTDRHPLADAMLLEHVELDGAHLVDLGASDGSTSVDLVRRLPDFASFVIADLFFHLDVVRAGRHDLFSMPGGEVILVVGPRAVAWPSQSRAVERLYRPVLSRAAKAGVRRQLVLLNPDARRLIAKDPRVSTAVHDIFTPWTGSTPDVVKVANVLRRLYFSDERIVVALRALLAGVAEGGHLLLVDNPRITGISERAGLYRRAGERFVAVDRTPHPPEIDELVTSVRLSGTVA